MVHENTFKADSKSIVDMLFENCYFEKTITRDNMNAVEELITFLLQSQLNMYLRIEELSKKYPKKPSQDIENQTLDSTFSRK
jgi:hypothetical protein